ncbi:hypothetical protein HYPSUDRAFT_225171 [Hypholoma sublateritium FD-334 SS-4]|uniref:Uncharacterized protein n=1 Tax=Hypholoma sublateritium (strain FD-334 SS-4) TaxID=945553 RepID=A0A0D2LNI2_HYPSF|nr:hypothetical protein HYPSUDRAFT_225171 [Hypholoma sublateritium FD-334 SS-4]
MRGMEGPAPRHAQARHACRRRGLLRCLLARGLRPPSGKCRRVACPARSDSNRQPSRFSISTTSTSAYIAVNRAASGPATPMALSHVHAHAGALAAANRKQGPGAAPRASWVYKLPGRGALHPTVSFSKLLPPWLKRPRDERWVLVDVRAIVLERVVDG